MRIIAQLGFCLFLSVNSMSAHDIHVSVAEMSYDEDGRLDVSLRIFFDDLLMACGLTPGEELPKEYKSSDELIASYVSNHFKLYLNGERVVLRFEDSFSDNLAVWIELKSTVIKKDQDIMLELENTILFKEFDDQINILNCTGEHLEASHTFKHKTPRQQIQRK